jgi:2-oxoglutarate ferredoxin oxidoreductase subunit alpha
MNNLKLMQGNEACLEGALAAGMRFFAGYPITPSTEIAEQASQRLPMVGGVFLQMEDEIASMAAIIGSSVVGVKSMTATSGPGFSLMQENIGYASLTEVPCVVVNVQRGGPSTGLPTSPSQGDVMQARWGTHGDHPIIAISPSSVSEAFSLAIRCFNLSEKYRVPVIFLMDEIVGHMREGIDMETLKEMEVINRTIPNMDDESWLPYKAEDKETLVPKIPPFGMGKRYHITGLMHDEQGLPTSNTDKAHNLCTRLMQKIEKNKQDIITFEEKNIDDADIVVVCYGGTARTVIGAMKKARKEGIKVGVFRAITIWPFPEDRLDMISRKASHIIVAEHNYGQIVYEVERVSRGRCKVHHIGKVNGTIIMPEELLQKIREINHEQ